MLRSLGPSLRPASSLAWATVDPQSSSVPMASKNFLCGAWLSSANPPLSLPDPLTSAPLQLVENTGVDELAPYLSHLFKCPKTGLHNPFKHPERLVAYGEVAFKAASVLATPEGEKFFASLIQRVVPKSWAQCVGEVQITRQFLKTFAGDSVRMGLGRGFSVSGDHEGQTSCGFRWPYGPVMIISPFNFPLEIPALQLMGALFAGNRVLLKPSERGAIVMDQFVRLLVSQCGLQPDDLVVVHGGGAVAEAAASHPRMRMVQFTGSSKVAERLASVTRGKVRIEDAGLNWKILGPMKFPTPRAALTTVSHVAQVCDQDAYAANGQKCSATSMLFMHADWLQHDLPARLAQLAASRSLKDLTIGPVLTWSTPRLLEHIKQVLRAFPSAKVEFGGRPLKLEAHLTPPPDVGLIEPTAIRLPIHDVYSASAKDFDLLTTEVFGPFQIIVDFGDQDLSLVLEVLERLQAHLTAAVVSSNPDFCHEVIRSTVNGTTYVGVRARTTGAPTNHWFGPAGDPRGAGIGTVEAILGVWTCHREIVYDILEPKANTTKQS